MELMKPHIPAAHRQSGSSMCSTISTAVTLGKKAPQKINELCNLPDVEITPLSKTGNHSRTADDKHQSISVDAKTSAEKNLKEKSDMDNLLQRLPVLNEYFHLHSKIGEGTFSTVYLATLRNSNSTKNYAVKHLTQNCKQLTIEGELRCMTKIGGKDNVVHADYCLTSGDNCVTFIMPYLPHKKFTDYVLDMNADETRLYMKNLFIALRRVHSFNIIHRDVKPGNFLYNRETKQFLLVDFGLAQVVQNHTFDDEEKAFVSVDENMPIDYSKKRKRKESASEKEKDSAQKKNKRMALKSKDSNVKVPRMSDSWRNLHRYSDDTSVSAAPSARFDLKSPLKQCPNNGNAEKSVLRSNFTNSVNFSSGRRKKLFDETSPKAHCTATSEEKRYAAALNRYSLKENATEVSPGCSSRDKSFTPLVPSKSSSGSFVQVRNSRVVRQREMSRTESTGLFQKPKSKTAYVGEQCSCSGRGAICGMCSSRNEMVAPRAGTPGFRPPEVLFKYIHQTTAVDMWAAGVILLCILSGCYPFFRSPNDLVALAEIMTVFGTEPVIKIAAKFDRRVVCSDRKKGVDLKKMCKLLRARTTKKCSTEKSPNDIKCSDCLQTIRQDGCLCISDNPTEKSTGEEESDYEFPDSAYDLLKRLLDLDLTTRITAAEALEHPFILGH